ncbi:MAG: HD domain-containing phosphohydrolase [Planctomycetota bacterium]
MDPAELQTLIRAIEAKDLATAAHTWRVVLYARAMAEEGGLGRDRVERISIAAALHDVGKLDIPSAILQKPGKLTDEEFAVIQQHPVTGYARMIKMDVEDEDILDLIRYHHERVDGKGYPYGLAGDAIPVVARYFAVIDTFDALTSIRPYRTEIGEDAAERALVILSEGAGSAFAPEAVELFTALYREQKIDHVLHYFNDEFPSPDFQLEQVRQHERTDRRNA